MRRPASGAGRPATATSSRVTANRGQHEELRNRRQRTERRHEPAYQDPLADGPGDRETREEPAKQQLIDHPSANTHAKPGHSSAFSAGHGDAHRLTIPEEATNVEG